MAVTTIGRQIVRGVLPQKYKNYADGQLNKGTIQKLTTAMAKQDPDAYINILQDLNTIGQRVVSVYGKDTTITLDDIDTGAQVRNASNKLKQLIYNVVNSDNLTQQQKQQKIIDLGYKYTEKLRQVAVDDAHKRKTGIANQIKSGSRGNAVQLMQLVIGDMMMKDAANRDIPYLAMASYADGDSPMSYWASAMSGRKSTYDVQAATGKVGYLGKQATNITHNTPIATYDCGTKNTGVPVKAQSTDNVGALLLRPWHNHPAGSVVTQKMVAQAGPDDQMVIRSPITCRAHNGVCALCSGIQENGKLPVIGSYVAMNAAKTFIQPLTQAGISCLHPGTKVRMADWSIKKIKDIEVGDMVIGVSTQGVCRPVKVTNVFHNGVQPLYLFKYRNGFKTSKCLSLVATKEHKLLQIARNGNTNRHQLIEQNNTPKILKAGHWDHLKSAVVSAVRPMSVEESYGDKHQPLALLLGLLLGDGCYTAGVRHEVHFSCADKLLIDQLQPYMTEHNLKFHLCAGQSIYYSVSKLRRGNQQSSIKLKLKKYNMLGKYAHQKELPEDVMTWDAQSASALVSGLIITDGSLYRQKKTNKWFIGFGATSLKMVLQVKQLIQKHCAAHCQRPFANKMSRKKVLWQLTYNKASQVLKLAKFLKLYGVKQQRRLDIIESTKFKTPHQRLFTCSRQEIKYIGDFETIDIEVDHPDHLFLLANNLVVSNSKHGSGIGGKKVEDPDGDDQPTGFQSIQRMLLAPKVFPGGAVLAPSDGRVSDIRQAPQGGWFVTVNQNTTYVPVARRITVKPGDVVQAGDTLTNGVPNPMQIVKYKGIGQGRRYFTRKLNQLLPKAGAGTLRRNLQQFSRAMINKVRITNDQGYGGYYPGDIVDYDDIAQKWTPRDDSKQLPVDKAADTYLQQPILYYSIGTRITPNVIKNLKKYDIKTITTNSNPPPFEPQFVRSKQVLSNDKHWLPRLAGERLTDSLFDAAQRGITDQYGSSSFVDKIIVDPYKPTAQTK